jgi:hypothetical protein
LDASNITSGSIDAKTINVKNIDADNITSGSIDAKVIDVKNLNASNITSGNIDAKIIEVTNLDADNIVSGTIDASKIAVTNIDADNITSGSIDAKIIDVKNLNADNITSGSLSADLITTGTLSASRISGGTLDASDVTIKNLTVTDINANNITSGTLNINRVSDSSVTFAKLAAGASMYLAWTNENPYDLFKGQSIPLSTGGKSWSQLAVEFIGCSYNAVGQQSTKFTAYPLASVYISTLDESGETVEDYSLSLGSSSNLMIEKTNNYWTLKTVTPYYYLSWKNDSGQSFYYGWTTDASIIQKLDEGNNSNKSNVVLKMRFKLTYSSSSGTTKTVTTDEISDSISEIEMESTDMSIGNISISYVYTGGTAYTTSTLISKYNEYKCKINYPLSRQFAFCANNSYGAITAGTPTCFVEVSQDSEDEIVPNDVDALTPSAITKVSNKTIVLMNRSFSTENNKVYFGSAYGMDSNHTLYTNNYFCIPYKAYIMR